MVLGPKSSCSKILDQVHIPPSIQEHLLFQHIPQPFKPPEHCFHSCSALWPPLTETLFPGKGVQIKCLVLRNFVI